MELNLNIPENQFVDVIEETVVRFYLQALYPLTVLTALVPSHAAKPQKL